MPFDHIDTWVFDLDNTLYNADPYCFPEMHRRMTDYVARLLGVDHDTAQTIREKYYRQHGTTLRGLMLEHNISADHYLAEVHSLDLSPIAPCAITRQHLDQMHGRKVVFTNAPRDFAWRMLDHLGIRHAFDGLFALEDAAYLPKPSEEAYDMFTRTLGVDPARACMLEDTAINLQPAFARGMATVWLHGDRDPSMTIPAPHIHHHAPRLPDFFAHDYFKQPHGVSK